jgi:hypothetical protein
MNLRELLEQQTNLYEEHSDYVVEEGLGTSIFQKKSRTFIDTEGPVTVGTVTLHRLDCGHIVGSMGSQELLGRCQKCGKSMCFRCGIRCSRCFRLLCPACIKQLDIVAYCRKCKGIRIMKRGTLFFLRRVHEGLSK